MNCRQILYICVLTFAASIAAASEYQVVVVTFLCGKQAVLRQVTTESEVSPKALVAQLKSEPTCELSTQRIRSLLRNESLDSVVIIRPLVDDVDTAKYGIQINVPVLSSKEIPGTY